MIYLSAQPDETYFIWQLEIQLRNFRSLGISRDQIQILVSYKGDKDLNPVFQEFIEKNTNFAKFYTYQDMRENPKYPSSIRPNILKQHFEEYPELEKEVLFYHDSDILFSRIPQIENLQKNDIFYVSDTRNYLDIDYIRKFGSENLLTDMACSVGIPVETIEKNKIHTGGAQYILKGVDIAFWAKVERDSESLYLLLRDYNRKLWEEEYPTTRVFKNNNNGIQAWCADMWAVLWNLWLINKKVEIHPEMGFSWPYDPVEEWEKKAIHHYSGNIYEKEKYFKKTKYINYLPWYDEELLSIPDTNCSYKIVEMIRSRRKELDNERPHFPDSCIVLDGRRFGDEQEERIKVFKIYLQRHLAVDLYLLMDSQNWVQQNIIANYHELLATLGKNYTQVLWVPLECGIDARDIQTILERRDGADIDFSPQSIYKVDWLFVETFSKVLDMELLHMNQGKFNTQNVSSDHVIHYINLELDQEERRRKLKDIYFGKYKMIYKKKILKVAYCLI